MKYFFIILGFSAVIFSTSAQAQSSDTDVLDSQRNAIEAILQVTGRLVSGGTPLSADSTSYKDVLADPDNIELNLRFARTQISQGNFRGASATLERILLLAPDLQPVQLLYAVMLLRQGNLDEAEEAANKLAALDLPDKIRAEVESIISRIREIRRRTRYTASVSFGGQIDSNRNTAPRTSTRLFIDFPVSVDRAESDFSYLGFANIRVDHDLGYQEGHSVFAGLSYFHNDQTAEDSQDLSSYSVLGGGVYRDWFMDGDLTATLHYTQISLSRETFLREVGGALRFDRQLYSDMTGYIGIDLFHQGFEPIRENSTSQERDGREFSGSAGFVYAINPTQALSVDLKIADRNAKGRGTVEFFSYLRQQVRIKHTWLLGEGQFLLSSANFQHDKYVDADPFISSRNRNDNVVRLRLTYGAPLAFVMGKFGVNNLWEPMRDITFTPSIEYTRAKSNLLNFDYMNWKTQALFTKSWSF